MGNDNTESSLKSLESLYVNGKFDDAIQSLIAQKNSFENGSFHYNLGTLYAKKGDYAVARFHFEKAIKAGFIGDEVLNNLAVTNKNLQVEKIESDNPLLDFYYSSIFSATSVTVTLILLYFLIVLVLRKMQKITTKVSIIFLLLGIVPIGLKYFHSKEYQQAILLKKTAVKEGPSAIFESHQELPAGVKLIVSKPKEGWYFIKYPTHFSGWIPNNDLGIL